MSTITESTVMTKPKLRSTYTVNINSTRKNSSPFLQSESSADKHMSIKFMPYMKSITNDIDLSQFAKKEANHKSHIRMTPTPVHKTVIVSKLIGDRILTTAQIIDKTDRRNYLDTASSSDYYLPVKRNRNFFEKSNLVNLSSYSSSPALTSTSSSPTQSSASPFSYATRNQFEHKNLTLFSNKLPAIGERSNFSSTVYLNTLDHDDDYENSNNKTKYKQLKFLNNSSSQSSFIELNKPKNKFISASYMQLTNLDKYNFYSDTHSIRSSSTSYNNLNNHRSTSMSSVVISIPDFSSKKKHEYGKSLIFYAFLVINSMVYLFLLH